MVYLLAHIAALAVLVMLWKRAPDNVQRGFLAVAFLSMATYAFCDFLTVYGIDNQRGGKEIFGIDRVWPISSVAGALAHGALLVYLARQWWIKTDMCKVIKGEER